MLLPPILQMLSDSNPGVRDAAILCIEEMYTQAGTQFRDELQRHRLPMSMVKDINARLERIEPKNRSSDGLTAVETKPLSHNPKRNSPKAKSSSRDVSLFGAETDPTVKSVEPMKVYSEKELIREVEKIASTLVPEKDRSIRIAAMQRIEVLVYGGAADYQSFRGLLKQLVNPLNTQLSDRRSSIVKQACHLLYFLSKELLGDFEAYAEIFIPMLRNCKVARVLPHIADCAKNDHNAILRARCCDHALLILEYWADEPEIQRSADLYEDLIRCCVADAMSEVCSTARMCYRMLSKTWPERSRRLFSLFDPVIQRLINEEDRGIHRRHASPSVRDRGTHQSHLLPSHLLLLIYLDMELRLLLQWIEVQVYPLGLLHLSQAKSHGKGTERSLESVLHATKQMVSAIESMLRGLELSDRHNSSNSQEYSYVYSCSRISPMIQEDLSPSSLSSALDGARLAYFDGRLHETALLVALEATRRNIPILIDAERIREGLDDLLNLSEYAICSAKFPQAWTEAETFPSALVSMLLKLPKLKFAIVTLGEDGCIMLERSAEEAPQTEGMDVDSLFEALKQRKDDSITRPTYISSPVTKLRANGIGTVCGRLFVGTAEKIPPSELVDTMGAGDSFIGAIIYAVCTNMPPEKMLPFAAQVAAACCRGLGARTSLPHRTDTLLAPFL